MRVALTGRYTLAVHPLHVAQQRAGNAGCASCLPPKNPPEPARSSGGYWAAPRSPTSRPDSVMVMRRERRSRPSGTPPGDRPLLRLIGAGQVLLGSPSGSGPGLPRSCRLPLWVVTTPPTRPIAAWSAPAPPPLGCPFYATCLHIDTNEKTSGWLAHILIESLFCIGFSTIFSLNFLLAQRPTEFYCKINYVDICTPNAQQYDQQHSNPQSTLTQGETHCKRLRWQDSNRDRWRRWRWRGYVPPGTPSEGAQVAVFDMNLEAC